MTYTPSDGYSGNYSVEAWVEPNTTTTDSLEFFDSRTADGEFSVDFTLDGSDDRGGMQLTADIGDGSEWLANPSTPFVFNANEWYYVVLTVSKPANSPGVGTFFVNGQPIDHFAIDNYDSLPLLTDPSHPIILGGEPRYVSPLDPDSGNFDGTMGQVAVYEYALSSSQVAAHYAAGGGARPVAPVDPPSVSIGAPVDGARYVRGQEVVASYGCRDGVAGPGVAAGPGIASCTGTVASGSPINTTTFGRHTFTVTATSEDGQQTIRTVSYTVVSVTDRFTIAHVLTYADGTVTFSVGVSGPGRVDVLETAWDDNLARAVAILQPAPRRFVFARAHTDVRGASTISMSVKPNARGQLLVRHHTYRVTLRLWATYTQDGGGSSTIGIYGLHLP